MAIGTPLGFGAHSGTASPTSLAVTLPAGTVNGVAVVTVGSNAMQSVVTPPTGWSEVEAGQALASNTVRLHSFAKTVTSADASQTVTFTFDTGARTAISGAVIPGGEIDTHVVFQASAETTTSTWAAITPTGDNETLVCVAHPRWPVSSTAGTTPPAGWTLLSQDVTTNGSGPRYSYFSAYKVLSGQGGVEQPAPESSSDPARMAGVIFAISEAEVPEPTRPLQRLSGGVWLPLIPHVVAD